MITSGDVLQIDAVLRDIGVDYWIGGGWGIDALLGSQTRDHDDLDISIPARQLGLVMERLGKLGYRAATDWLPVRVAVRDGAGREIDLHPIVFETDGSAWLPSLHGGRFDYPADSFTTGTIGGRMVPCINAGQQAVFHQGYEPQEKDRADMAALLEAGLIDSMPAWPHEAR